LFQAVPLRDESGNIVKWYGSSTDIEDRKRTEVAPSRERAALRDYAETASNWLWETGPDHRVTRISEHFNAVGVRPSSRIDMARWILQLTPNRSRKMAGIHRAMLDAHQPFRDFVYRMASGSGSPVIRPNKRQAIL